MSSDLVLHCGAQTVSREVLDQIPAPPPTRTWFPLSHSTVLDTVGSTLRDAGFATRDQHLGVTRNGARFFGTLDLKSEVLPGVGLAVGVRNSIDKSLPIGFCAGSRVFVCDNLAFSSEVTVARKHTRFGQEHFARKMVDLVGKLGQYREAEAERIKLFKERGLSDDQANSYMLKAYERRIVPPKILRLVIDLWRKPTHDEFRPRTAWSLLNAFTTVLKDRQANPDFARLTIRLQSFLANGHAKGGVHVGGNDAGRREQ